MTSARRFPVSGAVPSRRWPPPPSWAWASWAPGAAGPATGLAGPAAAQAATVPVIYNYADGWRYPTVRPQWVTIGQGGSPMAHTWYWNTWNAATAKSTGTLWVNNCIPTCAQGKNSYHKLYVTLYWVKSHNGTRSSTG